ncbi:tetratricopeptide repeat protein [Hufsiella ginkgonis]|uniref:Tetratricopeptide repeat protein n=1 Tax=Hufsiella ginkgonis TaxID=2695274 RepID=A0A7K1XZ57_9SPHI|nr:tetratricopeptide repeat protein [Hufsiella ginkgonis]MXV16291.1 tetratricopeptide repeat protein [Hufsiella ginkgonis]
MLKPYIRLTFLLCLLGVTAKSQQTSWFEVDKAYKTGLELFEKGKFAAASAQFSRVDESRMFPSDGSGDQRQFSLLKENAEFYRAVCALELGNDDAEKLFLKFINDHPVSANARSAYYQVGRFYFKQKNYPKTIEWFKKIEPQNLSSKESEEYRFKLGYSYFFSKDYVKAEPLFASLKDGKSEFAEPSIYYYAYLNYADADYKTALREFERLKGSKTYEKSYPYYISALYFLDKRYDDVLRYTIPATATIDDQYKPEMNRIIGASYFARSDYKNAGIYYQRFQDKDLGKTQNNQDSYQIGYTAFKNAAYAKAVTELEKMTVADAYYQHAMITLGNSFLKTGNKQGARNAFFRASKLTFDAALQEEGLFNYAKLSYELEFHSVALDAIQLFLKTYPKSARTNEAKTLLAEVLLTTKNYKEAVIVLESITNKNQDARLAYQKVTYFRGLEFYNERAFENAISMLMRSAANGIDKEIEALATYWLAEAMFEVRKYGESVVQFEKFLALPAAKKTDVYNYANYAIGYSAFQNDKYAKAATYFERFIRGGEQDKNTLNDATLRLADSYFVNRNYGDAMEQYNKIIAWRASGEDYALFQRGMIFGLQQQNAEKIATLQSLLKQYPGSNYADDADFEIAYTYFVTNDYAKAKAGLTAMLEKYPRSSYAPRALVTIGLVQYNQDDDAGALTTFQRVVSEYSTADEAKQALESIKNIYLDKGDSDGFLTYANSTNIGNLTTSEQDNITFQAAYNRYQRGDFQGTFEAVNAYFDKFSRPIHEKQAKFIRAESLVKLNRPDEAVPDYTFILNDWTSEYTERSLISIINLYLKQKKYNEAVVYLKKLELTAEYKANYGFAINNLLEAYSNMQMPDDVLKYVALVDKFEKSSKEEKYRAMLFGGKAYLMKGDTTVALRQFQEVVTQAQTISAAEAKYNVAEIQYLKGNYKAAEATIFELTSKLFSYDYWVAKSYVLLADVYVGQKNLFQAKETLKSIIEGYKGDDDILPSAKAKLESLNKKN